MNSALSKFEKIIGLRIDVDTFRGTAKGVPKLCELLKKHDVRGTFYFSVGPDNMGRHLWRLLKPKFLWKMLRTNAAGLYGPEIVLMGTAWPGLKIGKYLSGTIRQAFDAGHEIGFHAWDHHRAQSKLHRMTPQELHDELSRGITLLTSIINQMPVSSAAPGWIANDNLLLAKSKYPFLFNSDCRGDYPFYPIVSGKVIKQLQIPVTLPTYDEALGRNNVNNDNYNDFQLGLLRPDKLNVLTVHAEAEGGKCATMFDDYLTRALAAGYKIVPLGDIAAMAGEHVPTGKIEFQEFPGREGKLAVQISTGE